MKIWITEYIDDIPGILIGPYIKADTMIQAARIAVEHGLFVIGEIQELQHEDLKENRTIH
jgi:hypothetical protein|tara:strand:- start:1444 stop:1623 length:180 start_codon:yes stop_codon:yes gene_type:complete